MERSERVARFERVYRDHAAAVLAFALRRSSPDEAADVTAETFVVAWRRGVGEFACRVHLRDHLCMRWVRTIGLLLLIALATILLAVGVLYLRDASARYTDLCTSPHHTTNCVLVIGSDKPASATTYRWYGWNALAIGAVLMAIAGWRVYRAIGSRRHPPDPLVVDQVPGRDL